MSAPRVRILLKWNGADYFFVSLNNNRPEVVPVSQLRSAQTLFSRDYAKAVCCDLRAARWDAHVVRPDGVTLFEEETAPQPKSDTSERVNHHVLVGDVDVLIVPGNPRGYFVRFPESAFESIYGDTPDAVAELYRQQVALRPELANFAERYIPPALPEQPQPPQLPRLGRTRPGSLR